MKKINNAFSLVELIVSLTILAVLITVSFTSYSGYVVSSKDSKRLIELDNIATSFETYQLKNGILPDPDNSVDITFSGATVWKQGIFGEGVSKFLGYSKEDVLDPDKESHYTYSVNNNGKEYSIAGALESEDAIVTTNLIGSNVGGLATGNAIVMGNYNGAMSYVNAGGVDYILAVPSIVSTDLTMTTLEEILDENNLVFNGYQNLPASYDGGELSVDNNIDFSPDNLIVFTGSIFDLKDEDERMALLYILQKSYSGSLANDESFLGSVRETEIDVMYPDKTTLDLSCDLVTKKLNYKIDCDYINFSSFYVVKDPSVLGAIDFSILGNAQVNYIYHEGDNLWFGTSEGAYSYDTETGDWKFYEETEGFKISVIIKDDDGIIWFGTSDSGLLVYDGVEFTNYQSDYDPVKVNSNHFTPTSVNGIPSNAIFDIVMEPSGNLIIGTYNGGSYYDGTDFTDFYVVSGKKHYLYSQNRLNNFLIDHNNHLWLGTDKGAYYYDGGLSSTPNGSLETYDGSNGLPKEGNKYKIEVSSIYEDDNYDMWFGTDEGIGKLTPRTHRREQDSYVKDEIYTKYSGEGLASNDVKSVFQDPTTSDMWFGTDRGVSVLNGSSFTNYTKDVDGSDLGPVYYIYQDSDGLNILGTEYGSTTIE